MSLLVETMNIHFEWPARRQPFSLKRYLTLDNAATFDVMSGIFNAHNAHIGSDAVVFYWHMSRLVILNLCTSCVCRLDDSELAYGSVHPLREASRIQAGHFKMRIVSKDFTERALNHSVDCYEDWQINSPPPEVEEILPNRGNYINDLRYFNDVILAQDKGDDILKTLEVEYKRFLIWQEQDGGQFSNFTRQEKRIFKTDSHFEKIRDRIKEKTLTECIMDSNFLLEKALLELGLEEQWSDIFAEEEKTDLLHALSPELSVAKGRYKVPELVFQDISKVGLDSYY